MKGTFNKKLIVLVFLVLVLEAVLFSVGHFKINEEIRREKEKLTRIEETINNLNLQAKSISVVDLTENKEIYAKNPDEFMPLASLAKTMTVLVALEKYRLDDLITISQVSLKQNGDSGLFLNEKWKVGDLIKFTLVASSNDGSLALAEQDKNFIDKMNNLAQKIGMKSSVFINSTGLDLEKDLSGVYSTVRDANKMAIYALKTYPEIFKITTLPELNLRSESGFLHNFKNTNTILEKIPNILFSKTGFTELAGGNLSIVFKNKNEHEIAITLFGSTEEGRFSDMESLINLIESNYLSR